MIPLTAICGVQAVASMEDAACARSAEARGAAAKVFAAACRAGMAQDIAAGLIDALGRAEPLATHAGALVEATCAVHEDASLVSV